MSLIWWRGWAPLRWHPRSPDLGAFLMPAHDSKTAKKPVLCQEQGGVKPRLIQVSSANVFVAHAFDIVAGRNGISPDQQSVESVHIGLGAGHDSIGIC